MSREEELHPMTDGLLEAKEWSSASAPLDSVLSVLSEVEQGKPRIVPEANKDVCTYQVKRLKYVHIIITTNSNMFTNKVEKVLEFCANHFLQFHSDVPPLPERWIKTEETGNAYLENLFDDYEEIVKKYESEGTQTHSIVRRSSTGERFFVSKQYPDL